ncbi:MAG: XRE family transcriptional regulator [Bacteroidales bacterium]|nr:XRE family transcriptional regulator [Bacteroidales bacterium]
MDQYKQIAERLKGLREALDLTTEEMAATCHLPEEKYLIYESGLEDIPVSLLQNIAHTHGVELPALLFGSEPRMSTYFVTRKGRGVSIERVKAYKYQSLAAGFTGRKADPFIVTVHPKPESEPLFLNSHAGQEFNMVLEGRLLLQVNGKDLILEEGDSIYFNSELPHGSRALDGKEVKFLAIIF